MDLRFPKVLANALFFSKRVAHVLIPPDLRSTFSVFKLTSSGLTGPWFELAISATPIRAQGTRSANTGDDVFLLVLHKQKRAGNLRSQPLSSLPRLTGEKIYLTSTVAPASSSFFLIPSASALDTPSLTLAGAPSTRSFASFSPKTGDFTNHLDHRYLVGTK